ncbi:MAG: DNA-directed RNA polymerase subunit H, partial [Nitrososphaerota archaeon]
QIIREIEDNQTEVLVVAAPRDIVETRINAVQHAGLETDAVELEAFALYRTLVEFDAGFENETTIAIIDIGGENTDVSIVDKGAFALTRSIPIAGKQLTRALENYFKLSNEEAEELLKRLDVTRQQLPYILSTDPMVKKLGAKVGDIIRIKRVSETAGEAVYYRVVWRES